MTDSIDKYVSREIVPDETLTGLFSAALIGSILKKREYAHKPAAFDRVQSSPPLYDFAMFNANPGSQFIYMRQRSQTSFLELETRRGTTLIDMNTEGQVVALPGEKARIATFGLGGCTAIGIVGIFEDGSRRAHVQHYDPFYKRNSLSGSGNLSPEEKILGTEAGKGNYLKAVQTTAVIMLPERGYNQLEDPAHAEWLTATILDSFGDTTDIHTVPYSNGGTGAHPYEGALVIDIPQEGPIKIYPSDRASISVG